MATLVREISFCGECCSTQPQLPQGQSLRARGLLGSKRDRYITPAVTMARDCHGRQGRDRLQEARGAASEQCFLDETNTAQTSSQFSWLPAQKPYKIEPVQRTAWTGRAGGAKQAPLLTERLLAGTGGRGRESRFSSGM